MIVKIGGSAGKSIEGLLVGPRLPLHRQKRGKVMENELRLFIWTEFCPDWTNGLAFAIAKDETEARNLIEKERGAEVWCWGNLEIKPLSKRIARSVNGGT